MSQTVYVYVLSQTCQHLHQTYNVNIWAQLAMFSFESILYTFKSDLQFKHFSVLLVFKHTNHVTYFSQYLPYSPKREYRSAVSKSLCTVCVCYLHLISQFNQKFPQEFGLINIVLFFWICMEFSKFFAVAQYWRDWRMATWHFFWYFVPLYCSMCCLALDRLDGVQCSE